MSKSILLVRHAESAENVLMQGVVRSLNALRQMSLPAYSDVRSGMELASAMVSGATDEWSLSVNGEAQVAEVRSLLLAEQPGVVSDLKKTSVLVAHSPFKRAKMTCEGLFRGMIDPGTEILELDLLREIVPTDYVAPSRWAEAKNRVVEFEKWVAMRKEENIVVVGHSHYFKHMLGVDFKFSNCEVWKVKFQPPTDPSERGKWTDLERVCGSATAKATFGAEGPEAWVSKTNDMSAAAEKQEENGLVGNAPTSASSSSSSSSSTSQSASSLNGKPPRS